MWSRRAETYNKLKWATEQDYLQAFIDACKFTGTDMVLDIGAGTGILTHKIAPRVAGVTGVDISAQMLQIARETKRCSNEQFRYGDARRLPFPGECFDKVMIRMVLRHLSRGSKAALREALRVLRVGGNIIVSEGIPPIPELENWYTELMQIRSERLIFGTAQALADAVSVSGFEIVDVFTHTSSKISVRNWIENAGFSPQIWDRIMEMHLALSKKERAAYNMVVADGDVQCDFKYAVVVGCRGD